MPITLAVLGLENKWRTNNLPTAKRILSIYSRTAFPDLCYPMKYLKIFKCSGAHLDGQPSLTSTE